MSEPIFAAHVVKTAASVAEEIEAGLPETVDALLTAALNRYLHTPFKTKHGRRFARQALHLVG